MTPKRKLWLHIGLPKTGTSSAQRSYQDARDELRRHGLSYPGDSNNHHRLVSKFSNDGPGHFFYSSRRIKPARAAELGDAMWDAVERDADFDGDILLSSEILANMPEDAYRWIDEAARRMGRELRVIAYLRHPAALASSGAQQVIKLGKRSLADVLADPPVRPVAEQVRRAIGLLGRERVTLRIFDRIKSVGTEHDLLGQIGYQGPLDRIAKLRLNESLSMAGVLLADAYWSSRASPADAEVPMFLTAIRGAPFILPAEALARVQGRIDEELAFIRDELGMEPPPAPPAMTGPFGLLDPEGARGIMDMLEELQDRRRGSTGIRGQMHHVITRLRRRVT